MLRKIQINFWQLVIIACLVVLAMLVCCEKEPNVIVEPLKKEIGQLKKQKGEAKKEVVTQEKEVVWWKTRYKTVRDTVTIPQECVTTVSVITQACDSVIHSQDTLIHFLKNEIAISDSIIKKQSDVIVFQDKEIKTLKRKARRRKFLIGAIAVVAGGVVLISR